MGSKTVLIYKINASDLEKIAETETAVKSIKSGIVKDLKREPIGFGVEVIKVAILVDEKKEGAIEAVTAELNSLESVDYAEMESMTLL